MAGEQSRSEFPSTEDPAPRLSLWDSICLIVGIIIGASIYKYPPDIFAMAGSPSMGMFAWFVGGIVSLIGALCYAELASAYRSSGGDYIYLTRAYGPRVGFIFAWAELSIIRTGGSIAAMAYIFAHYATEFHDLGSNSTLLYAIGGIVTLTVVNAIGIRPGRSIQNSLTVCNFVGLGGICLIGLGCAFIKPDLPAPQPAEIKNPGSVGMLAVMMVFVFYAYGGWNEAAFISSEVKNPKRNIRRALLIGTSLVMLIYMAVNLAYISALGYERVCGSKAVAADMFAIPFGEIGRKSICALVMISSLGSINGLLFTGMRLYGTFGKDHKFFSWLTGKDDRVQTAYGALFAQALFSLILIAAIESALHWRQMLAAIAPYFNMQLDAEFKKTGDINRLVACTAPVFWIFFLLTGYSLFVLRRKDPQRERPFKVPLYPYLPIVFCASCAFMLWRSTMHALDEEPAEALIVAGLMLFGIPLGILSGRATRRAKQQEIANSSE